VGQSLVGEKLWRGKIMRFEVTFEGVKWWWDSDGCRYMVPDLDSSNFGRLALVTREKISEFCEVMFRYERVLPSTDCFDWPATEAWFLTLQPPVSVHGPSPEVCYDSHLTQGTSSEPSPWRHSPQSSCSLAPWSLYPETQEASAPHGILTSVRKTACRNKKQVVNG